MRGQVYFQEIIPKDVEIPPEHKANVFDLLVKLNTVRFMSDFPMRITSGYRTREKHRQIYIRKGFAEEDIPWGSYHLIGGAADVYDPNGHLKKWLNENIYLIEKVGLYIEDFDYTDEYVHFQTFPYASYAVGDPIFFKPY